jgi:hypothetical protein
MNSEVSHTEIESNVENEDIFSQFEEYLEMVEVRDTENDEIRMTEDINYRIV